MTTAVVIGGGLGGLSASYYLGKASKFSKVILVEASNRCGGWVHTDRNADGSLFELGPRSCRVASSPSMLNALYLTDRLGLSDEVVPVKFNHPASKNRFFYVNQQMYPVKINKISSMFRRSPPFSRSLFRCALQDTFANRGQGDDESIQDFMNRRLGKEFATLGIGTMLRGIYAGDIKQLSMKSCFPELFAGERQFGSLRKAVKKQWKERKVEMSQEHNRYLRDNALLNKATNERWTMFSFKNGYQQLTDTLEKTITERYGVKVLKNSPCSSLEFTDDGTMVHIDGNIIKADHVVSAMYSKDLAGLLPEEHSKLSQHLNRIPAVNVVIVSIELPGEYLPNPQGFGHLVPESEDSKILGVIYDSCMFSEHDNPNSSTTRFTMMMGGAWYDELVAAVGEISESSLQELALETLFRQLNIDPIKVNKVNVRVLKNCIPQYVVGHSKILDGIDSYISDTKLPLSLVGSSYRGISTADVIYDSKLAIEKLVETTVR